MGKLHRQPMFSNLASYFVPNDIQEQAELYRRYKLVIYFILITALFDLNYAGITVLIGLEEGTLIMLIAFLLHLLLPILLKKEVPLLLVKNLYIFIGVLAIVVCISYSGGFISPVLPWLATSPIVALLMGGKRTGVFWVVVNSSIVVFFGLLHFYGYRLPSDYDHSWDYMFFLNCYVGLVVIIFCVALVFENGKNAAFRELAEKNILLAEEKKKIALQKISQEIHDNIGQTLSLAKLNLHSIQKQKEEISKGKVVETLQLVAKAIQDLRELSNNLHSDNIIDFNIVETIREEINTISSIGHYATMLEVSGSYHKFTPQTELILYRIYQEIINNVIKHSGASSITIRIGYDTNQLSLSVKDNGSGIKSKDFLLKGQGIRNMQSRAKIIGGRVDIRSENGEGTTVSILLPVKESP